MKENNMKEQIDFQKKLMEDYWLKKIAGVEDFFNNPAEKNITGKYDSLGVEVEPSITARIKNIARHNEISECIILLSVYSILLYKYYQHPTMIILSPGMKANPDAVTGDNGISPLFYKLNIGAGDSIKQILQNTHREFHETMAYKDYDYNRLKSILERRNIEMAQVYQVGFFDNRVYIEYPAFEEPLLQLRIEGTTDQKLQVRLKYETDLFEEAFIYQFLTHYQNILYYLDKDLDVTVEKIEILSLGEKQALVFNFNAPSAVYPVDKTLVDLFEQQAEANPDRAAVYSEDIVLTYRHLDEKANRLANYLKETRQTTADDLIAFMLHRSEWLITAVFGVLKSGAGYLPLSPDYPGDHIRYVLNDARAKVVIAEDWNLIEKKGLTDCSTVSLQDDWPRISNYPNSSTRGGGKPGSLAYVIYTSGSTGKPKGVMVEHHNVVRLLFSDKFQFQFGPDDSWTLFHSPWFDFSVWEIFGSLLYGGRLVVLPEKIIQTPGALLSVVEKEQITVLNQIPFVFYNLIAEILKETGAEKRRLSLRYVIFGGDALNPQMLKRWAEQYPGVKLINMYGITETTVHVTYKEIGGREIAAGKSNIGKPIPTLSCYIIDRDMRLQPIGIMGEIVVGGDGVSRGYLNRIELTHERFVRDPYDPGKRQRLYRSGDLGKRLVNGDIEYMGRMDAQVKIRGHRIECGEIETKLAGFAGIKDVVVIVKEDEDKNKYLAAYFTAEQDVTSPGCRAYLEKILPDYMIPSFFIQVERFPKTATGKIDKKSLPEPGASNLSGTIYEPPRNEIETRLVNIWQEVLKVDKVGINDNFFNLGGNSVKGIHVVNKVQQWLKEIVHVTAIFEAPTVKELAAKFQSANIDPVLKVNESKVAKMRAIIGHLAPLPVLPVGLPKNPPAAFILSPPRSGTTLLRVILAGHPRLFAPPELELLEFNTLQDRKKELSGKFGYFSEGVIRAIMEIKHCSAGEASAIMGQFEEQGLTSQALYGIIEHWLGDRILLDKTPWYALDLEVLKRAEAYFEGARYIHLLRDPYASIHSFEEARLDQIFRYSHDFSTRELAELVWLICNQNILDFFNGVPPERKFTIKFEDIVREPEGSVRELCRFLGIEYREEMIRVYENTAKKMTDGIHPESKMLGDIKFFTHSGIDAGVTEKWKKRYKNEFLGDVTINLAQSFGYLNKNAVLDYSQLERAPEQEYYELSHAQRRLWILAQLEENQIAYNIPQVQSVEGDINREILAKVFETVIRRHESLRTTFVVIGSQPRQKINDFESIGFKLEYSDLRGKEEVEDELKSLVDKEMAIAFDLQKGPLIRAKLFQLADKKYVIFFNMHHIICDGWSMRLLVEEFLLLYGVYRENRESPLEPLIFQYKDYSYWQTSEAGRAAMKFQETFWLEEFSGDIPVLNLPTDFPRPSIQSFAGNAFTFEIGEEQTRKLVEFALQEKVTLYMLLLSVYAVFLSKLSGQEDVIVGTGIAGRRHPELRKVIGMFVNTLALRTYPIGMKTFRAFLQEVRAKTLLAFDYQDYPFDELVDKVVTTRDRSRNPLVDAIFLLQNLELETNEMPQVEVPGIKFLPFAGENLTSKFDISFYCSEVGSGLSFTINYCTKLFKKETIEKYFRYYKDILSFIIENKELTFRLKDIRLAKGLMTIQSTLIQDESGDFGF